MDQCPFCIIAAGEDPEVSEVYRDDDVVVFFPREPATLGHTLLVPKRHVDSVWDLNNDEAAVLARRTLIVADAIRDALAPEGLNIIQSNGEAATQTVPHLHIHLVPRTTGDAMGPIWPTEAGIDERAKERARTSLRLTILAKASKSEPPLAPEDRRKHLDYIQAVITRQSAASSSAKSWLLTILVATFGFALTQQSWALATIGLCATVLFAYLDANYLKSEKQFRRLYNTVARSSRKVPLFSLNPGDAEEAVVRGDEESRSARSRIRGLWKQYVPGRDVWLSWSIAPFYAALITLGLVVLVVSASVAPSSSATPESVDKPICPAVTPTTPIDSGDQP